VINTADARGEGFGQVSPTRMALMASQISDVYATKTRVNPRRSGTAASCRPSRISTSSQEVIAH
jgi:hypothetical protein